MNIQKYLPHIDGLRGIAVLLVLLFHIDVSFCKGGYIGVDIFFVISGFLISTILINKIDANNFSFKDFYIRRINRLLPALLFVVVLTIIVAYFIFPYHLFEKTLKSSIAGILSFSNIYFFKESGYFDTGSDLKPFLHAWSLSVEEQFYFIWPLLLFFTLKLKEKKHRLVVLISIAMTSLFFSEYFLKINSAAAFFLTPYRVFEFLIGTLLFWIQKVELKNYLKEIISFIAFSGLMILSYIDDSTTLFPGINALLPCCFAAILIHNTGQSKYVSLLYNNKVTRWLGKISYSLYLVHWPIIVFYKFIYEHKLAIQDQIILFIAALLLGLMVHKYIEKRFREVKINSFFKDNTKYVIVSIGLIILINVLILKFGSLIFKAKNSREYSLKQIDQGKDLRFTFCNDPNLNDLILKNTNHKQQVLLLGDSHAPDALNFLKLAYPNYDYRMLTQGGCPPMTKGDLKLIDSHSPEMKNNCYDMMDQVINMDLTGYEFIVVNILFDWYKPDNLIKYLTELKTKTNAKIIVFGNYIIFNKDFVDFSFKEKSIDSKYIKSIAIYEDELELKSKGMYKFISKKKLLCKNNSSKPDDCLFFTKENAPLTYDSHHLSYEFAAVIADSLISKKINVFN